MNLRHADADLLRVQRALPPAIFPCPLVERHRHAALASDETDQLIAIDQRMPAEAPDWRGGGVVALEVFLPKNGARFGVEAEQVALRAQGVDAAGIDCRRAPRPVGVGKRIWAIVFVLPEKAAVGGIKAKHPLATGELVAAVGVVGQFPTGLLVVGEIDAALETSFN